jgi:ribosomal-protein-alanine N-acetyltransferase
MAIEASVSRPERLVVEYWHLADVRRVSAVVAELLTPAVTRSLPPEWQGDYDEARAERWISDRDAEGTTLMASEDGQPVGLVLLYKESGPGGVTVRLGYLIAEGEWGRGLGGELVAGLVVWCRTEPAIRALIGGVAADNTASIRILERSGFKPEKAAPEGDLEYRLNL